MPLGFLQTDLFCAIVIGIPNISVFLYTPADFTKVNLIFLLILL